MGNISNLKGKMKELNENFIVEKARAKTNLVLDVLYKRDDGFHELGTLFQTLELHEEVTLIKTESGGIDLSHDEDICVNLEDNLMYKAARLIEELSGETLNVNIECNKTLPMGAGLGGGSADAAAVLRGLIKLFSLKLDLGEVILKSAKLGADIPFMVVGGTQWATGIGEVLSPSKIPKEYLEMEVLVATPNAFVGTAEAYGNISKSGIDRFAQFKTQYLMNSYQTLMSSYNVFEDSVYPKFEEIVKQVEALKALNPLKVFMSGSGASLIALFPKGVVKSTIDDALQDSFRYYNWTKFDVQKEIL